jgi:hypothetical protein
MLFNGLPEMKVQNVHVENSVFRSKQGAVINRTSGLIMKNIRIESANGEFMTIMDVDNATLENLTDRKGKAGKIIQTGENKNVVIK